MKGSDRTYPDPLRRVGALFRGDFARRIERAGIMNLRHLMIAVVENLPQDFVGVFPEQGRAGHLGRAVRQFDGIADR